MGHGSSSRPRSLAKDEASAPKAPAAENVAKAPAVEKTIVETPPPKVDVNAVTALAPPDTSVETPEPVSPKSSLAERRKMKLGLQVAQKPTMLPIAAVQPFEKKPVQTKKTIRECKSIEDFYELGKEVMESSNAGMEVRFAKRVSDKADMVIKTRQKVDSFSDDQDEQEWRRSTEMLLNLPESESICQLHEVLDDGKTYYVVMEKIEGMDLFEVLNSEGCMPIGTVKVVLKELLKAVKDLHAQGCIHKDLKLENVMVESPQALYQSTSSEKSVGSASPKRRLSIPGFSKPAAHDPHDITPPHSPGNVKIIDFDTVEEFEPHSLAKNVVGTDQYIAPEAYTGHYSTASDIFSVGVIAYRLVSGRFPFVEGMFDDGPGENWVGCPKMKVIHDRLKDFHINFESPPWPSNPKVRDLTRWMLEKTEKRRPSAKQALAHPFFETSGQTPALPQATWGGNLKRRLSISKATGHGEKHR